jgi:predicted Fe-S protein YdhL (DUF1289 family)
VGCGRTLADITGWSAMSEDEQLACVQQARARLPQLRAGWGRDGEDGNA